MGAAKDRGEGEEKGEEEEEKSNFRPTGLAFPGGSLLLLLLCCPNSIAAGGSSGCPRRRAPPPPLPRRYLSPICQDFLSLSLSPSLFSLFVLAESPIPSLRSANFDHLIKAASALRELPFGCERIERGRFLPSGYRGHPTASATTSATH